MSFAGEFYQFDKLPMILKPLQKPHPPLWYGVTLPGNAAWPAENNVNIVALGLRDNTSAIIKAYRETRAKHGLDPDGTLAGVSRHIIVADTDEAALAIARRAYPRWRTSFRWLFTRHGTEPRVIGIYPPTFDELIALNNGIAGSPDTVRRFVEAEVAANGCNYFVPQMVFGDMTLAESLRSIELFANEIMPAFEISGRFFISIGTIAASLELRSVSEVLTLRTCGAPVSSATKAWKVFRSGATHFRTKSISPDSIQHSRTSGCLADEILERREVGLGLAGEMHHGEHGDLVAEQLLVEQRPVALDEAGLLQRPHPAQAGRRRNADPARQLHIGDAAVLLQFLQDFPVDGVETGRQGELQSASGAGRHYPRAGGFAKHYCAAVDGSPTPSSGMWIKGCVSCIARPNP